MSLAPRELLYEYGLIPLHSLCPTLDSLPTLFSLHEQLIGLSSLDSGESKHLPALAKVVALLLGVRGAPGTLASTHIVNAPPLTPSPLLLPASAFRVDNRTECNGCPGPVRYPAANPVRCADPPVSFVAGWVHRQPRGIHKTGVNRITAAATAGGAATPAVRARAVAVPAGAAV